MYSEIDWGPKDCIPDVNLNTFSHFRINCTAQPLVTYDGEITIIGLDRVRNKEILKNLRKKRRTNLAE